MSPWHSLMMIAGTIALAWAMAHIMRHARYGRHATPGRVVSDGSSHEHVPL